MNFSTPPLRKGTIFVQVVISLAMAGIMLSATLGLQITVFKSVIKNSFSFVHAFPLRTMLETAQKDRMLGKEKESYQKTLEDPKMAITLEKNLPLNTSSLARFRRLFKETSRGEWAEWSGPSTENLFAFIFVPEPQKKKDEKK